MWRSKKARQPARRPRSGLGKRWCSLAISLGLVTGLVSVASADRVTGRVTDFKYLTNPVWAEARNPDQHGYSFREPVPTVPAEFRRLFPHIPKELCLAAIATSPQKAPLPILVRVGGGRTTPVTIVVPPGTQLSFKNTDPFPHRLYGVGIKTFPPNETGKGAAREWTVPAAGVFEIRDELAPSLRMWVVGEPNVAAIAYPSLSGQFSVTISEPGDYEIQAYFAGKKVGTSRKVTVEGKDIDLSRAPISVADKKQVETAK